MVTFRFQSVIDAGHHKPVQVNHPCESDSKLFAANVFTREKMEHYIAPDVLTELNGAIQFGQPISRSIANGVAEGMKAWALHMGATHYTHWFQPLTGGTAEKHDAFFEKDPISGEVLEEFSGKVLYQQEPDASSFPNGGIRNTFEARGYSAWDPTSPAFIVGDTLCIPTIFVAYTGEALDYKTPLLRSVSAINKAAVEICHYFDEKVKKVTTYLGWEQEYFLVDESLWLARQDLMLTGRTLFGHASAKNQQLEDHYFGAIPERVLQFMRELEVESLKLGIPVKTRHNEAAPNQFELAPLYEEINLSIDHNLLLMSTMERVAERHHFRVLFHEKPYAGVNGSGKHCNWSLGTDKGVNLLAPGKDAVENLRFITFLVIILRAVYKHNGLLKASIVSATNAHRLGGNEAPPAIISVFLGSELNATLNKIKRASTEEGIVLSKKKQMSLGVATIPELLLDNTDRNRTSPFAFTGNRFEFRAVGSSANCGAAMLALNAAVADEMQIFKQEVDRLIAQGRPKQSALFEAIKQCVTECEDICFDGNGYGEEWKREAKRRGLDCETSVPLNIDRYLDKSSIEMFARTGVLTHSELKSRCEVKWETYSKKVQIESRVLGDAIINHIIPIASKYEAQLLDKVAKMRAVFGQDADAMQTYDIDLLRKISSYNAELDKLCKQMIQARHDANHSNGGERTKAVMYQDNVIPLMEQIRERVDELEMVIDDELWPMPKYRELMFVK